jgi:tetratricopeptide (TPR) repeat protein
MMRWIPRALLVGAVAALGVDAWKATAFDARFRAARLAYEANRSGEALAGFIEARAIRGREEGVWEWIGDTAGYLYRSPPSGGWDDRAAENLLQTAWGGYAGTVLRSPLNTWSWSGLAEVALNRAERRDKKQGVALEVLDRRATGRLDMWRGIALVAARTAVDLKPSGFQELDMLTRVYTSTGQLDAARETVVRSAALLPAPSFHTWGTGRAFVQPLYEAVVTAMRQSLERIPDFERSRFHHEIGRFAIVEMRAALASAGNDNDKEHALRGIAQVLEAMGRLDESVVAWNALLESGLAFPVDRRQRGIVLYRAGHKSEACRDLREAIRGATDDDGLRVLGAAACEEAGELETAERLLREGFSLPIDDPALARGLVDFYLRHDRRSTAEGLVRAWARDYPQHLEFGEWEANLRRP